MAVKSRVGVVGCGFIAQSIHIPSWLKCRRAALVAVCDKNGEMAAQAARRFKVDRYYSDLGDMLMEEGLDIVDVCTSINTHAPLAIQAMEAGCNVLVEKPIAINSHEAGEMIVVSQENGVKLGVVHDMLFGISVMKIREMVKKGAVGDVVGVEIRQNFPAQDFPVIADPAHWWHRLPGGVFGDSLPHPLYLAREFLGELEPAVVHTRKIGPLAHMPFDELRIVLEGDKGIATIISSCNSPSLMMIDVLGTEMNLHGDLYSSLVTTYKARSNMGRVKPSSRARANVIQSAQILLSTASTAMRVVTDNRGGHRHLIDKFVESTQNGKEPPVTAEDGIQTLRLLEKITSQMA